MDPIFASPIGQRAAALYGAFVAFSAEVDAFLEDYPDAAVAAAAGHQGLAHASASQVDPLCFVGLPAVCKGLAFFFDLIFPSLLPCMPRADSGLVQSCPMTSPDCPVTSGIDGKRQESIPDGTPFDIS